jgi:hypothetical protein
LFVQKQESHDKNHDTRTSVDMKSYTLLGLESFLQSMWRGRDHQEEGRAVQQFGFGRELAYGFLKDFG